MERQKFEDSFKDAFDEAEVAPSDSVWTNVELDLEKASGGKMKRRLLFFQLLAAASMVFAMGIGGVYYLDTVKPNDAEVLASTPDASQTSPVKDSKVAINTSEAKVETESVESTENSIADNNSVSSINSSNKTSKNGLRNKPVDSNSNVAMKYSNAGSQQSSFENTSVNNIPEKRNAVYSANRSLPGLVTVEPMLIPERHQSDAGKLLLARLQNAGRMSRPADEKQSRKEKLWTSVGVGMGSFNPNSSTSGGSAAMASVTGGTPSSSNPSSGTSYSVGVTVATKVADRVVLQGGISYLSQKC